MGGANGLVTWSSLPCQLPAPPLALFAAHAVCDEFSHAAHACLRASRIAALPSELFASLQLGFEHAGIRGTIIMRVYIIVASLALSVIGKASGTVVDTGADTATGGRLKRVGHYLGMGISFLPMGTELRMSTFPRS